ncbi:Glucosamine-6-phosphate isomerase (Glucosamine-6-phosphate deaminase) (GNPDA) (GlcN6P deaminase) [Rhodotorula toruloides]
MLFSALLILSLHVTRAAALWPRPRSLSTGSSFIRLGDSFEVVAEQGELAKELERRLAKAIARTSRHLQHDRLRRLTPDRGESDRPQVENAPILSRLFLSLNSTVVGTLEDEVVNLYTLDESYSLSVPAATDATSPTASAHLSARTLVGLLRGLETFTQLIYFLPAADDALDGLRYIANVPLRIEDRPAFPYRGFMLDTARNWYPIEDILRTLDTMASTKVNTFHWHITDQQSFPLEIPTFPDLATFGAYSADRIYSTVDVAKVVEYGQDLGIAVMLEVDMPGHTASIANAYPEHIACLDARPWSTYAAEPPAGQLRLGRPDTLAFSKRVLQDAAKLSSSAFFSSGGDEVNKRCYLDDPETSAALESRNSTVDELLDEFVRGLHETLVESNKTPVVWEELVLKHDLSLAKETVVMVWIDSANVRAVADKGHRIIHAASHYFYLDCGAGAWLGRYANGTSCPFKTWSKSYSFDPLFNLTREQHELVLGGEALLWSEQAGPETLDSIAWRVWLVLPRSPRAAAAAEVFWTGGSVTEGERSVGEALPRLHDWRYRAVQRGVKAIPLQPHWCALRPGQCDVEL